MTIRCLEFYSGIGGLTAAAAELNRQPAVAQSSPASTPTSTPRLQVVAAVDIDRDAAAVYRRQYPGQRMVTAEIASFAVGRYPAELWWLSPPCLPFTRKGRQRDAADRRTESLVALLRQLDSAADLPRYLAIENVPPFAVSDTGRWVQRHLESCGFQTAWQLRCPTAVGVPMRRKRCFLLARRGDAPLPSGDVISPTGDESLSTGDMPLPAGAVPLRPLVDYLDPAADGDPALAVPAAWLRDYRRAWDVVDRRDPAACTACFTSSYTKQPIRSGSVLRRPPWSADAVRFFSPDEIARLLGFPQPLPWPETLRLRRRYALVGNSVHVPTVAAVLGQLLAG